MLLVHLMRLFFIQKRLILSSIVMVCFLLLFPIGKHRVEACSWDQWIWMIRSKNADPLYRFVRDDKAGYIDGLGKVVIEPTLDVYGNSGGEFHDGLLEIGVYSGKYIDTAGKRVIDKWFERGWAFSEGLAVAMPSRGGKWGYIDHSGEFVISPRFETYPNGYVYSFSEGLAMIETSKRYGYINRFGDVVIPPRFLHGTNFHDGMARVINEGPCSYSNDSPCPEVHVLPESDGREVPRCKFTFIDKTGTVVSAERYDRAKDFSEGLAPVRMGGRWGYIDKKGHLVIKPIFEDAEPFSEGFALVQREGIYGYVDRTGAIVIPPQFKHAESFVEGRAVVGDFSKGGDFYYINKLGQQAFPLRYALASHFYKGLAHVKLKSENLKDDNEDDLYRAGKFAYITPSGKEIFIYEGSR
jgi:hypothetical protein